MTPPRFQFQLRTLFVVTTLAALPLGWWAYKVHQQRHAVAVLKKSGAAIAPNFRDENKVDVTLHQKPTVEDMEALKILRPASVYLIWIDAADVAMLKRILNCEVVTPPPPGDPAL